MTLRKSRGFSLLELMIVILIGLIMAGVAFMALMPLFRKNHVDQGYDTVLSVMRTYRNLAITQYTRYIITVPNSSTINVQSWGFPPVGSTTSPAPQQVAAYELPQDIQFAVQAGFPNPGPDSFGTGASAIYTQNAMTGQASSCTVVESGQPCVVFFPDGSAQDDQGNFESGVIYLTQPTSNAYSSRAIDVYGTTGRVRGWRLYNVSGTNTWEQQ
jgi:prepilin-type N-terminal cleavage/methylation domain-containing protein